MFWKVLKLAGWGSLGGAFVALLTAPIKDSPYLPFKFRCEWLHQGSFTQVASVQVCKIDDLNYRFNYEY